MKIIWKKCLYLLKIVVKDGTEKKKEEVTDVTSQESEKQIVVEEKEINDQEKEIGRKK